MNNLLNYIKNELKETVSKRNIIQMEIHRIELDIETIGNAENHILDSNDLTELPFYSSDQIPGFNGIEIERLKNNKAHLLEKKVNYENNLNEYDLKIKQLEELIHDNNNNIYKDRIDVLNAQEVERQRIASDIHDTVVQNMSAIIYKNDFITKIIDTDQQRAKIELSISNKIIKDCISELRTIIYNLRPMSLNDLDFRSALSNIISHAQDSTDMKIEYKITGDNADISSVVLISVIRIIQELCNNSIKHSKGKNINLTVNIRTDNIAIDFSDDGVGYDTEKILTYKNDNSGFGLSILRDRVNLLGGKITVQKNTERGVYYKLEIPISKEKDLCQ